MAEMGLAWVLLKPKNETGTLLFHSGGTGGFNCNLFVDKERKLVLVVNYNSYNGGSKEEAEARSALNNDLLLLLR